MTLTIATMTRRAAAQPRASLLREWLQARSARVAVDRLDDHMRRDIGLPARAEPPLARHEAAARIVLMSFR